jgi:acyl-CoA synthetase (NDP forming)
LIYQFYLFLKSLIFGRLLLELARSSDKSIVVLKGGKNPLAAEAAASHTRSLAGHVSFSFAQSEGYFQHGV